MGKEKGKKKEDKNVWSAMGSPRKKDTNGYVHKRVEVLNAKARRNFKSALGLQGIKYMPQPNGEKYPRKRQWLSVAKEKPSERGMNKLLLNAQHKK